MAAKKTGATKAAASKAKRDKKKALTKSQLFQELAERTGLAKKQVADLFDALSAVIHEEVSRKGPGQVTLPGLLKLRRVEKKATKARKGRNPATGEEIIIPAKPKTTVIRARVLKVLQEAAKK